MTPPTGGVPERRWRFRLQLATGLALVLFLAVLARAVVQRTQVSRQRLLLLSQLERLADAEEEALTRDGRYAPVLASNGGTDTARFVPAAGLVFQFTVVGEMSWGAVVQDSTLPAEPRSCGMFKGDLAASPHRAVVTPGVPACW